MTYPSNIVLRLVRALEFLYPGVPDAEKGACHVGICTQAQCAHCQRCIEARDALGAIHALLSFEPAEEAKLPTRPKWNLAYMPDTKSIRMFPQHLLAADLNHISPELHDERIRLGRMFALAPWALAALFDLRNETKGTTAATIAADSVIVMAQAHGLLPIYEGETECPTAE